MVRMGVEAVAYAMPGGEATAPSAGRPVDMVHLARQTFGDRALEAEILSLFVSQTQSVKARLRDANGEERKRLAHGIKGSARSVGAFALGDAAAVLELSPANDVHVREIERRIDDVADFVAAISR